MSTRHTCRTGFASMWGLVCCMMVVAGCGTVSSQKARPNLNREHRLVMRQVQRPMMSSKEQGPLGACLSRSALEKGAPESYIVLGWTLGHDGRVRDVHALVNKLDSGEQALRCMKRVLEETTFSRHSTKPLYVHFMYAAGGPTLTWHVRVAHEGGEPSAFITRVKDTGKAESPASGRGASLDVEAFKRVLDHRTLGAELCYMTEMSLRERPINGEVAVSWVIQPNGGVSDARVVGDTLGNASVRECVLASVRQLKFSSPQGGPVAVSFPFVFQYTYY